MSALVEQRGVSYAMRSPRFTALVAVSDAGLRGDVVRSLHGLGAAEVTEAASIAEAQARTRTAPPSDLLVVETMLSDGTGVSLINALRASGWQRCIVIAADGDPFSVRGALAAGVRGFVVGSASRPAALSDPARVAPRGSTGVQSLSAREIEVLRLVADGQSNREIGTTLHLSALTVKSHLARIARKLGTGDRAEMVAVSMRARIID